MEGCMDVPRRKERLHLTRSCHVRHQIADLPSGTAGPCAFPLIRVGNRMNMYRGRSPGVVP
jgi:hypothetical protein